jgi:hypothetical protein
MGDPIILAQVQNFGFASGGRHPQYSEALVDNVEICHGVAVLLSLDSF